MEIVAGIIPGKEEELFEFGFNPFKFKIQAKGLFDSC